MKGLKTLTAVLCATALIASAAPASAGRGAYKYYVACSASRHAAPSHSCARSSETAAFFKSFKASVFYKVCVKFPTGKKLCAPHERATRKKLSVARITSNTPGKHTVTWFVGKKRAGRFTFTLRSK